MKIIKLARNTAVVAVFALTVAVMSGCGGVSDAEMQQLQDLRSEVNSLQSQADQLKDQRASLEKEIADRNSKLQQCDKAKEETKANLSKMGM
jgi:septal ring factor EnvC (AmiA/AmiB activator)